jgi:DNA-binding transcriptional LysR family regulator
LGSFVKFDILGTIMEIRQLEIFCAVVRQRGFSTAAETLNLTQPTVSFQIASLEEELGIRLLDRSGRNTIPTRSGEVLHRYALQILELTAEAEQAIHQLKGLLWGEISIGASTIPGEYILPGLLPGFRENHPGIALEMIIGDTREIMSKVLQNEVEIGVVGASEKSEKLTFIKFISDTLVLIAPADNSWFAGNVASLGELQKAPFVLRERGSGTRAIMEQKLKEVGFASEGLNISMILGSTEAVKRAVASGAGVSIVSERAVLNEVELGTIKMGGISDLELTRDFFIVHRKHKVLSPAAEALVRFLQGNGS